MNSLGEPTGTRIPIVFHDTETAVTVMVARAMTFARSAQVRWARTPMVRRLELIRELRRLIAENAASLSEASASARQRPAVESLLAEVLPVAEGCRFLERKAEKILAPRRLGRRGLPLWLMGVDSEIHRDPLGVVLIIGPGNYPLLLPGLQVIQTLVAGNAVLLKPGVGGTVAAQALCELIVRAGFDPQLVTLLPETSAAARIAIEARPDKVIFTGSAATGEIILGQLASELIPATMELSGCDAVIICDDADMNLVVKALTFGLKINDGATCMAPKRVFISASRVTELEGRLAELRSSRREEALTEKAESGKQKLIRASLRRLLQVNYARCLTTPLRLARTSLPEKFVTTAPCSRRWCLGVFRPRRHCSAPTSLTPCFASSPWLMTTKLCSASTTAPTRSPPVFSPAMSPPPAPWPRKSTLVPSASTT